MGEPKERSQQGLTTAPDVMHELKESQVNWQLFLGEAPMRAQPRTQQRPKTFHSVDMDLMETVTILIHGRILHGCGTRSCAHTPTEAKQHKSHTRPY